MPKRLGETRLHLPGLGYCVAFNSRKSARAVTKLYDLELVPSGIRSTQFAVLIGLAKSQPVSIGDLAETLLIDTTTLTRSLRLMRKQGLLTISERSTMRQRYPRCREESAAMEKGADSICQCNRKRALESDAAGTCEAIGSRTAACGSSSP